MRRHAQGRDGRLFGKLSNFRRDLEQAAERAKIPHVWPHSLRKAAGQFLIDLHVPVELVSRMLGHADSRITENVYARVREQDLGDRMLCAIDPKYARRAIDNRDTECEVQTITVLPEPRATEVLYEVDGVSRTLTQWAKAHAIPKTTLFSRVIERGMSMADAIKLGSRGDKKRENKRSGLADSRADMHTSTTAKTAPRSADRKQAAPKLQAHSHDMGASAISAASPAQPSHASDPAATDCRTCAADTSDSDGPIGQKSADSEPTLSKKPRKSRVCRCPETESNCRHEDFQSRCRGA